MALPGRRILLRVLVSCLSVLLGPTLLGCSLSGRYPLDLMRRVVLAVCLMSLISVLMGAFFRVGSRMLVLRGLCFLLIFLVSIGPAVGGAIWMMMFVQAGLKGLAVVTTLFLVLYSLFRRAEFWGVIVALQAADGIHLGVDNLGVVRHVGRLIDGNVESYPAELVKDGDLILLIGRILEMRGRETVRTWFGKVGFASLVAQGTMTLMKLLTLDDGELTFLLLMLDATLLGSAGGGVRWLWSCIAFFSAISRVVVNHDDGEVTAPDPLVWSAGALPKSVGLVGRCVVMPCCLVLHLFGHRTGSIFFLLQLLLGMWERGRTLLVFWSNGLPFYVPGAGADLGVGGVSYVEMLNLCELWAGERLVLEKAVPRYGRPRRPISVSATRIVQCPKQQQTNKQTKTQTKHRHKQASKQSNKPAF